MWNSGLGEAQSAIKIAGRNISNFRYTNDTTLMAESEEELNSLLMKVKESEKAGLKLNIQKTKIMASGSITPLQIDGETMEIVTYFIFLGSKITTDSNCYYEIRRCLLLRRKAMTNLVSVLKSTDITLPTKVHIVKPMIFPVVMYDFEHWTEHWKTDAFELCCWRFLRVPWTAMRSILRGINPEYSLEALMLKLKLQYFGHLMRRADLLEKTRILAKVEGRRRGDNRGWDGWMASPTQWPWVWVNFRSWWWTGRPGMLHSMGSQSQTRLQWLNWTKSAWTSRKLCRWWRDKIKPQKNNYMKWS